MLSASLIKAKAQEVGFTACGIAPAEPLSEERIAMRQWMLDHGYRAGMDYLERNEDKRRDPRLLVEGAQTVISLALPFSPQPQAAFPIASYAFGPDYHETVKARLFELLAAIGAEGRCFVDTAPIDERYWAWRCGIGFIGRSGFLIIPHRGSYQFLGELVITDKVDAYDTPLTSDICSCEHCGTCRRCIECCPGQALSDNGLDARRCLSYLTIEHRGPLPPETGRLMHATPGTPLFYGCDRCAELCPYNQQLLADNHKPIAVSNDASPDNTDTPHPPINWQTLTREDYQQLFKGSAVKRAKCEGLLRNIEAFFHP